MSSEIFTDFNRIKKEATQPVFGYGNPKSEIVFIGEAPGKKEDEMGEKRLAQDHLKID